MSRRTRPDGYVQTGKLHLRIGGMTESRTMCGAAIEIDEDDRVNATSALHLVECTACVLTSIDGRDD